MSNEEKYATEAQYDMSGLDSSDKKEILQAKLTADTNKEKNELGFLGRFFGKGENNSRHIAFILCLIVVLGYFITIYIICSISETNESNKTLTASLWGGVVNLIAGYIGYLFGKGKEKNDK